MKINKKTLQSERTKAKLLASIDTILRTEGFRALKIERISKVSATDKKLVYFHFGDQQGLFDHFLRSRDFWNSKNEPSGTESKTPETMRALLTETIEQMDHEELLAPLLLWELGDEQQALRDLAKEREEYIHNTLASITAATPDKKDMEPLLALLLGGIYYLEMVNRCNDRAFCGIDIREEKDSARIIDTIKSLFDQ